jgi:integrase/recombinase XerD
MIDEMTIRKCAPNTQHDHLQLVRESQRSSDGLRLRQPSKRCAAIGFIGVPIDQSISTLRFFFKITLRRHDIVKHTHFIQEPRRLPVM